MYVGELVESSRRGWGGGWGELVESSRRGWGGGGVLTGEGIKGVSVQEDLQTVYRDKSATSHLI